MRVRTLILGAGVAGLRLASQLRTHTNDFFVLEQEATVGGLCRTNRSGRFRWDFGVHALYSRNPAMTNFFEALPFSPAAHQRNAKIFYPGAPAPDMLIDYPFEIGIRDLPWKDKIECVVGYLIARSRVSHQDQDLARWMRSELGGGIVRLFMSPYNAKIWSCPLEEISASLVTRKIHPEPVLRFLHNVFIHRVKGRKYQARFVYPRRGIQEIPDYFSRNIRDRIALRSKATRIKKNKESWQVETDGGAVYTADSVVSTIPLVALLNMLECPGVEKAAPGLRWNDTFFVLIGLKGPEYIARGRKSHWIFFKGREIFYRVTFMHNFSSEFACALVAEITRRGDAAVDQAELCEHTISDLMGTGIVSRREGIERAEVKLVRNTYPIPTTGLAGFQARVSTQLGRHRLYLLGRNGTWEYMNIDETIRQAEELYERHRAELV